MFSTCSPASDSPIFPAKARLAPTGFCRLAGLYSFLEKMMFGRRLEQARFYHLDHLRDCRDILLLGEGDGRCLAQLAKIAPHARLYYVDSSPAMLARATHRLNAGERTRVVFIPEDVRTWQPAPAAYDAVVTVFFLDCFSTGDVRQLVEKLQPALRPGARWLWADFVLPERGFARWRAQVWLGVMFGFFRQATGLATRTLPPSEEILSAAGWQPVTRRYFSAIFTGSGVFNQPG